MKTKIRRALDKASEMDRFTHNYDVITWVMAVTKSTFDEVQTAYIEYRLGRPLTAAEEQTSLDIYQMYSRADRMTRCNAIIYAIVGGAFK